MATAYLFGGDEISAETILSVAMDDDGQVLHPLALRHIESVKTLCAQVQRVIFILPSQHTALHTLELPLLSDKQARQAIPYALEDEVAQDIQQIHFSFDRRFYADGRYLVITTAKDILNHVLEWAQRHEMVLDAVTLDWFALENHEACVLNSGLIIHTPSFSGYMSQHVSTVFPTALTDEQVRVHFFPESVDYPKHANAVIHDQPASLWVAQRLCHRPFINVLQGDFRPHAEQTQRRFWLTLCATMMGVWLVSLLLVNGLSSHRLAQDIAQLDERIARLYFQFFPEAKQVINPRARITQQFKQNGGDDRLFILLNALATAIPSSDIRLQSLRYQNKTLQVTLSAQTFQRIEALESQLSQQGLTVKPLQTTSRENDVRSTLELS